MIEESRIIKIARDVATSNLSSSTVRDVISEGAVDSEGHDALRITIVIEPKATNRLKGDALLDTLVQIQDKLREAGEERFPIVEYATEKELLESGDS